jgi:hypothetical protein
MVRRLDCVYVWRCFQASSKEASTNAVQLIVEFQPCFVRVPPNTIYRSHAWLFDMYDSNVCIFVNKGIDSYKCVCGKKTYKGLQDL